MDDLNGPLLTNLATIIIFMTKIVTETVTETEPRSIQIVCEVLFMQLAVCFSNGGRKEIQHTLSDNI